METEIMTWWDRMLPVATKVGLQIAAAFLLYMVGRWLIGLAISMLSRVMTARNFDATLQRYSANILAVVLNILLVVAVLGGVDKLVDARLGG